MRKLLALLFITFISTTITYAGIPIHTITFNTPEQSIPVPITNNILKQLSECVNNIYTYTPTLLHNKKINQLKNTETYIQVQLEQPTRIFLDKIKMDIDTVQILFFLSGGLKNHIIFLDDKFAYSIYPPYKTKKCNIFKWKLKTQP